MGKLNMTRIMAVILILLSAVLVGASKGNASTAGIAEVFSRAAEVTVYSDRAIVKRSALMELKQGSLRVALTGLPASLIDNSVRVSGRGTVPVKIFGTEVKRVFLKREIESRVVELKTKLKELRNREQILKDREDILVSREKFLDSIQIHAADQASKELKLQKMDPGVWEAAIRYIFEDKDITRNAIRDSRRERQEVIEEIDILNKELSQIQSIQPLEKKTVFIDLEAEAAGSIELEVSYMVNGARWAPMYDARFDLEKETLQMIQHGTVIQNTGEDWNDVVLFLSTARPALGASAPKLRPWHLQVYTPPPVISRRDKAEALAPSVMPKAMKPEMEEMRAGEKPVEAVVETAEVFPRGTSLVFKVPKKENIAGRSQPHKITVAIKEFKPSLEYLSVPKLSAHAFLKAAITNTTGIPLLSGPVNVFSGPDYVGSTRVPLVTQDEKFELQLGVDSRIKVSRELLKYLKREEGLFQKNQQVLYGYLIKLENYTNKAQTIYVQDQLPVSQDEKIKVERRALEPAPQPEKPEDQGILTWKVVLQPQGKSQIRIEFSIEFPKDIAVQGI